MVAAKESTAFDDAMPKPEEKKSSDMSEDELCLLIVSLGAAGKHRKV